jgi:hypothetical protein
MRPTFPCQATLSIHHKSSSSHQSLAVSVALQSCSILSSDGCSAKKGRDYYPAMLQRLWYTTEPRRRRGSPYPSSVERLLGTITVPDRLDGHHNCSMPCKKVLGNERTRSKIECGLDDTAYGSELSVAKETRKTTGRVYHKRCGSQMPGESFRSRFLLYCSSYC